ncbi:MAG: energy transducer TonB [Ginsengibacter sp.]
MYGVVSSAQARFYSKTTVTDSGWHTKTYLLTLNKLQMLGLFEDAIVNEDGQIINAEVTVPLHPEFDKIALEAVKNSPKWLPAISQNRKVYSKLRETVTFLQSGY